ncbi:hypothetical protein FJY71_06185, partial [candidate division WOR-3 bacterium]|nr:hypothetical protein [candidate division WOR-3 bacterium]
MSLLLCLLLATGIEGTWRSHTNTDYINDVCGDDSTLGLATTGGVVVLDVAQGSIQRLRAVTNSDSLPVNRCVCIAPDPDGNFWVGTDGGGLAVVPAESGRAVSFRPSDLAMRIRTLLWDGDRLLVGTEEGLYDVRTRGTFLDFGDDSIGHYTTAYTPELLSDRVLSLFAHEGYWIGTNRGVTRVDRQLREWTPYRRPLGDSVRAMALLDANLLVGTEHGVAVLDSGAFRPLVQFPGPVELNDMAVRGSDVYVGTPDGLFKVDTLDSAGLVLVHETDVRSILLAQTIWLGCGGSEAFGSGLHYLRSGQGWQWYGGGSLTIYDVNDCVSTPAGDVYCCHYSTLVSRLTPDGIRTINDPLPNAVMARPDSRGRVWFAHFAWDGGLSVYDPQTGVWERTQWGAGSDWNI